MTIVINQTHFSEPIHEKNLRGSGSCRSTPRASLAERMAHATYHLAAARLGDAGGVALHRMAEGEIRRQEEPAVAALLHNRLGGAGNGVGVPGPMHADRRARFACEI